MKIQPSVLLDCRPLSDFVTGHHRDAGHIAAADLPSSMHLLPEPAVPLIIIGDAESIAVASKFLLEKQYQLIDRWLVDAPAVQAWQAEGVWVSGKVAQRLWQPSPLVTLFVDQLMTQYDIQPKTGLDVACGSGRDAVYLSMHGWQMTAVDVQAAAVARAKQLAERQQAVLTGLVRDLETGKDPFTEFTDGCFDLVHVARYLHRPLFPFLKRLIAPKGVVLYHTFMVGSQAFGSPRNPNFLLKPGELAAVFSDFTVLLDEVVTLADGRPMTMFVARR